MYKYTDDRAIIKCIIGSVAKTTQDQQVVHKTTIVEVEIWEQAAYY